MTFRWGAGIGAGVTMGDVSFLSFVEYILMYEWGGDLVDDLGNLSHSLSYIHLYWTLVAFCKLISGKVSLRIHGLFLDSIPGTVSVTLQSSIFVLREQYCFGNKRKR
jgi:hypothetical protein